MPVLPVPTARGPTLPEPEVHRKAGRVHSTAVIRFGFDQEHPVPLMSLRLVSRYIPFALAITGLAASLLAYRVSSAWLVPAIVCGVLTVIGIVDLLQPHSTLRRIYPLSGHLRYLLESIGPEFRQYFIESDSDAVPFSREQRSVIYQRAKNTLDKRPFGTLHDVYAPDYEWMSPSLAPVAIEGHDFRVNIGESRAQPYSASVFNISAMSFGAISPNAIRALNEGARRGRFYHDTGEGSVSPYHRERGGDLVWNVGSGYFGCRDLDGRFDDERFVVSATLPQVKMVEIKLSQGAKPGHGGVLPGAKVTAEIAATRGVRQGEDCISPARHSAFSTPIELLRFVDHLRQLSGGKPTGFKLAIGHPWEWFSIAKAMRETNITPDFIVVDGGEGGTGAAPLEFINHVGAPLRDGLMLVHNTLVGIGVRDRIRIGAAGKITTAFDIARTIAIGADWCNAARGYMFSLGCIQSMSCHTDRCPTGIATQDPRRWGRLDVPDKSDRVFNYHDNTLKALRELLSAAGLRDTAELGPEHIIHRVTSTEVRSLGRLYRFLDPGQLLAGSLDDERLAVFKMFWADARPDTFEPPARVLALRTSKLA
jgi:glutamate synthase domain-containing protein 2